MIKQRTDLPIAHFEGGPWDGIVWAYERVVDSIRPKPRAGEATHAGEYLRLSTTPQQDVFYSWFPDKTV